MFESDRMASLFCMAYPFYLIVDREKSRTSHLQDLQAPTLIYQGMRDQPGSKL
ncbi:MAG: alpha/beta family hydrolase [Rhizobiaceae bacterium]